MWVRVVFVVCCVVIPAPGYGSVVDIDDAIFASMPPLYALDNWSECQRPGDVYCLVDATLFATKPSPTLMLLENYSKQTLKHFNRTQIHRGVCVTRCGKLNQTTGSWGDAAETCLHAGLGKYGLQAQVISVAWCMNSDSTPSSSGPARALAVFCTLLIALGCLATGVHVLGERCAKTECNRFLLAFSIKQNIHILIRNRRKSTTDNHMKDIACIEGIRFLGMQCVIFSHVLMIYAYSYIDNPQYIEKMYDQLGWQAVFNTPLWLQAFFTMSGFLTTYTVLTSAPKGTITLVKCLTSVLNRWIRLTPVAVFGLWFTMAWFPLLGSGPQWSWLVEREATECLDRWWYHLLYVHNHLSIEKSCMGHTWYLATDMQLHVFGVILLLVVTRSRAVTIPLLMVTAVTSAVAAGLVVYLYNLTPIITLQTPEVLRTVFAGSHILSKVLVPSWMNLPGYIGGMATAFILHHNTKQGYVKLKDSRWFNVMFHSALLLGGVTTLAGTVFLSDFALPQWSSALYAALDRSLVAVFFCIFMLGCFTRCCSPVRDVVEWRGFVVLGRLSYSVFVVHVLVVRLALANTTHLVHVSLFSMLSLLISTSVLSYLVAVPLCLLVELPLIHLWKAFIEGEP